MALESFFYNNEVEAEALFTLAINAQKEEKFLVAGHLLNAWSTMMEDEDEMVPTVDSESERYAEYRRIFAQACYGRAPIEDDEIWEPDWPTNCGHLPWRFVRLIAKIDGQKAKADLRNMQAFHRIHERDEATLSRDQFKTKYGYYPSP